MPRRSFRDRFLTPPVARAMMSPLGMVLFGAAAAGSILVGLAVPAAIGVGVAAWAARVGVAVPRNPKRDKVEPFVLAEQWRKYVVAAQQSKQRFDNVVGDMHPGPLRDRLRDLAGRLADGIDESWRIAKRGNEISEALARLDTLQAETGLAELRAQIATRPSGMSTPTASEARTIQALEAQLQSADRLQATADDARDRLRLLDARFDELVARAVEVSVGSADSSVLGDDVDALVTELEALRIALDETNQAEAGGVVPKVDAVAVSSLLKSNLVVATGTAASRITGVLRLFVFGAVIGQTALADAYKLANETPNIIYDLLLGGVLSATLVPLFSSLISDETHSPEQRADNERATNVVITVAATLMLALTAIAVLAAPLIFRLYSLNVADDVDPGVFRSVGTTLTRIFLVQIFFYGITGLANAYLQSRRRFLAAAWSPVLSNLVIIAALLSIPNPGEEQVPLTAVLDNDRVRWTLGFGATLGIATMAIIVAPAMIGAGLRFRPAWEWRHPVVRKLLVLSGWTIGFVAANQVAVVVIRNLAQGEGEGLLSAYVDAFLWFVLPHGLLAVSISTTFQPELARAVIAKQRDQFVNRLQQAVRVTGLLTLPAAAGLLVIGRPIVGLMQRGNFDAVDADNTAEALAGLAVGLAAFSIYLLVMRGFYAHHDTRTPFVINVGENLLNIVLAVVFIRWWGVFGLGLAFAVAYVVAGAWALQVMSYKVAGFSVRSVGRDLWRPLLAALLMAEAMWLMTKDNADDQGVAALVQVLVAGTIGVFVYAAVLFALRTPDLETALERLPPRGGRRRHAAGTPSETLETTG